LNLKFKNLIVFPKEASKATTGIFFPKDNYLITGHENGLDVRWDLIKQKLKSCMLVPQK